MSIPRKEETAHQAEACMNTGGIPLSTWCLCAETFVQHHPTSRAFNSAVEQAARDADGEPYNGCEYTCVTMFVNRGT